MNLVGMSLTFITTSLPQILHKNKGEQKKCLPKTTGVHFSGRAGITPCIYILLFSLRREEIEQPRCPTSHVGYFW
jgi:hypothetical protein